MTVVPEPVTADDVAACLRVLATLDHDPADPRLEPVRRAVAEAHRSGKKRRKVARRDDRRQHDRALLATAGRYREELPSTRPALSQPQVPPALNQPQVRPALSETAAQPAVGQTQAPPTLGQTEARPARAGGADGSTPPERRLRRPRRCYVCKEQYLDVDLDYHMLCPPCAGQNRERREARCDLTGRRAIITGGRVKIGFHTALKLLRDGAEVVVTTRFPDDAARRFGQPPDAAQWRDRLAIHGVDFIDLSGVLGFLDTVRERWSHLDILINNAAQTIKRPPEYYRALRAAEKSLVVRDDLFPLGLRDETGEQLDLRDANSWTLRVGEVSPREWLETHVVNAFVPFLLSGQLRPLLAASPHPDRYVVQVSAMEGSFSRVAKTDRHPHTNMAKASLNMLTRTVAGEYATDGIYMSSVDTGWVTDERPHRSKQAQRAAGFRPPLDVIDGAARVYDPIVRGLAGDRSCGVFLKDYREVAW